MDDLRPYIKGLGDIELSNLLRSWFKHEKLKSVSSEDEEIIRQDLFEHANDLEESRLKVNSFIDGLITIKDFTYRLKD